MNNKYYQEIINNNLICYKRIYNLHNQIFSIYILYILELRVIFTSFVTNTLLHLRLANLIIGA